MPKIHLAQVIHHALVYEAKSVFYVKADLNTILYVVLITFPEGVLIPARLLLSTIFARYGNWEQQLPALISFERC